MQNQVSRSARRMVKEITCINVGSIQFTVVFIYFTCTCSLLFRQALTIIEQIYLGTNVAEEAMLLTLHISIYSVWSQSACLAVVVFSLFFFFCVHWYIGSLAKTYTKQTFCNNINVSIQKRSLSVYEEWYHRGWNSI